MHVISNLLVVFVHVCGCMRACGVCIRSYIRNSVCISMFYAWDYSRCSHGCELLPVGMSYKTVMCSDKFRHTEVRCKGMGAEEKATCLVEELKTNLMSRVVFISLIFARHVSNINMSIFRSLRL